MCYRCLWLPGLRWFLLLFFHWCCKQPRSTPFSLPADEEQRLVFGGENVRHEHVL